MSNDFSFEHRNVPAHPSHADRLGESVDARAGSVAAKAFRVLAIASGGGHWVQLLRLRPAWHGCDVAYATTHPDYEKDVCQNVTEPTPRFHVFPDANMTQKLKLLFQLLVVAWIIVKERPSVVISTGASAGYFALRIAKYLGCRTIWIDSIANAEELSLAGKRVEPFADLWLTQWPELARTTGDASVPQYFGAVI